MGHRANLVLVERGAYTVRYGHWSALDLAREIFIGPEAARRYVLTAWGAAVATLSPSIR